METSTMEDFLNMMVTDSGSPNTPISTLVFMDLEATGLPAYVGRSNVHITEISLIAVDRADFEVDDSLRVLNKLSLCVQPRAAISPGAISITGLYNDVLENQKKFDESVPKLLEYFFRRLRRPLCLLAHNGNKYDFPLLQAELQHINYSLDPAILCADTLEAFRCIVPNGNNAQIERPLNTQQSLQKERPLQTPEALTTVSIAGVNRCISITDEETENILSQDIELFNSIVDPSECMVVQNGIKENPLNNSTAINTLIVDERTPPKASISDHPLSNRPQKRKPDPTWVPKSQHKSGHPPAKRQLLSNFNASGKTKVQYSLEKLYRRFFNEDPPQSHYAEADCIALSRVCQRVNPDFLKWIDEHSTSFSEIKAMW